MLGFTCSWSLGHFQCSYDNTTTSNRSEIYLFFFCEKNMKVISAESLQDGV